ncbi:MAG: hypothetical protein R3F62_31275 [Planctomycetota bacterium]
MSLGLSLMPEPGFLVELPRLTRLELEHPAELELDPGPQLTELALGADEATCRQLLARWTGRALPLRRLELRVQGELLLEDATWAGLGELRELRAECGVFACPEAPLPHLETLDLRVMHASELGALLAGSPGLRELRYTGALGRLDPLAALPALEALYLGSSARTAPPALAALAAWPRLTRLGLSADLQAGWPQAVAALTGLTRLDLDAADRWPAEAWAALRGLPALRELVVRAAPESAPAWLGFLDGMPLTRLHLQTAREGDLEPWPALPELRHLSLVLAGEWSAEAFEALLAGGRLESLQLGGALVPARALEPLAELQPALESLRVHAEGVDDRTLEALGRLPVLRELELVGVEPQDVTQIGWKALLRAPLERLHLSRVPPPGTSWRQALRFTLHSLRGNLDVGW